MTLRQRPAALDPSTSLDHPLIEALGDAKEKGAQTKIAIDLRLYYPSRKLYVPWRGVAWKVVLESVEGGRRLAEGIDLLCRALEVAPKTTITVLRELIVAAASRGSHDDAQEAQAPAQVTTTPILTTAPDDPD